MKYEEMIWKELRKNNHIITTSFCKAHNIPTVYLTRLSREKKLFKIASGVYSDEKDFVDQCWLLQHKNKQIIYSHLSALSLINETEWAAPHRYYVSVPFGYKVNTNKYPLKLQYHNKRLYDLGVVEVETEEGRKVKAYSYERVVCDIIKNYDEWYSEFTEKALDDYPHYKNKNIDELLRIAKIMNISKDELKEKGIIEDD